MATFSIFELPYVRRYAERVRAAAVIASAPAEGAVSASSTAADSLTLRGIPAVGRGVSGHVVGTQPERAVCR